MAAPKDTTSVKRERAWLKASIIARLTAGKLASNTFDWANESDELLDLTRVAEGILNKAGL